MWKAYFGLLMLSLLTACGGGGGGNATTILQYEMIGTDGQVASASKAGEINPGENLGRFSFNYTLDNVKNVSVNVSVVDGDNRERIDSCCDTRCINQNINVDCQFDNTNAITCNTTNRTSMNSYFSKTDGIPHQARLELSACINTCSSNGSDFNILDRPHCQTASVPIIFR